MLRDLRPERLQSAVFLMQGQSFWVLVWGVGVRVGSPWLRVDCIGLRVYSPRYRV